MVARHYLLQYIYIIQMEQIFRTYIENKRDKENNDNNVHIPKIDV